jgi:hypothetical protein
MRCSPPSFCAISAWCRASNRLERDRLHQHDIGLGRAGDFFQVVAREGVDHHHDGLALAGRGLPDGLGRGQAIHAGHVPVGQHHVVGLLLRQAFAVQLEAASPESTSSAFQPQARISLTISSRVVRLSSATSRRSGPRAGVRRASAGCASTSNGTLNQKRLPLPSLLATAISPPIMSIRCLLMARPRPVPPKRRVMLWSPCEKA